MIVELSIYRNSANDGFSYRETRECLRNMNEEDRQTAIARLSQIGQRKNGGWASHVVPFVRSAWPLERRYRTSTLVSSWIHLLDDTGDSFPLMLRSVKRFLVPVERENIWLYSFSKDGGESSTAVKFPLLVLELLDAIIPNSPESLPHFLSEVLATLEESDPTIIQDRRFQRLIDLIELSH